MTMGDMIMLNRKKIGITQEELGKKLNPTVQRAAINKWESGEVENIKRAHIIQMAALFGISPAELMCFDTPDLSKIEIHSKMEKRRNLISGVLDKNTKVLFDAFDSMNEKGQSIVLEICEALSKLPEYKK